MGALKLETYTYDDYKNWEGDWELIQKRKKYLFLNIPKNTIAIKHWVILEMVNLHLKT